MTKLCIGGKKAQPLRRSFGHGDRHGFQLAFYPGRSLVQFDGLGRSPHLVYFTGPSPDSDDWHPVTQEDTWQGAGVTLEDLYRQNPAAVYEVDAEDYIRSRP